MSRICLCLTGKTLAQNLEALERYHDYLDLAELRVDCLDPDERFLIRRFPEMAGIPVILTIRRITDGGFFKGGDGSRISLLSKGLAFADVDRRRNFAYVDLEEDLNVPSLEEAARTFGTRIIRSYHNTRGGADGNLSAKLRGLRRMGDEIPKVAVMPNSLEDTLCLYKAAAETADIEKIIVGMGHYGINTRILAEKMGSYLSYTSAIPESAEEPGEKDPLPPGAPGQLNPRELAEMYRFRETTGETKIFGVVGYPLNATSSPAFFNRVFAEEKTDAVYVPFPANTLKSFLKLAEHLNIQGASVTVPYKEEIIPYLLSRSDEVKSVGACNTIVKTPSGWAGYNTDTRGFADSLLNFLNKPNLRGKKIAVIGAGGAARAVAAEVFRLKGKALILNRTPLRARRLAQPYRFKWAATDSGAVEMVDAYSDIIIQTTPVGMEPDTQADPLEDYKFTGKEKVIDIIYKPERTRFLTRAMKAGCAVMNGYDMLLRQAMYQYRFFIGREFPAQLKDRIHIK
jgi:3-dehydroquinate dehydratase/shikimate dehydrogenase